MTANFLQVKQSNIASLKSRNSKQSQEAWESTLSSILLDQVNEDDTSLLEGVEAVTEIVTSKKADSLHINIQKRIEGITVSPDNTVNSILANLSSNDLGKSFWANQKK